MSARFVCTIFLAVLTATPSLAADNWFCSEESSRKVGTEVHACGTGVSADESEARLLALDNATKEYQRLCAASADCRGHAANADPGRTTCEQRQDGFHCKRLVVFTLATEASSAGTLAQSAASSRTLASAGTPKIEKSLSKREVLARFGEPSSLQEVDDHNLILYFGSPDFCEGGQTPCTVVLYNDHVDHYFGFRAGNTRALEERSFWEKLKFW